MSYAQKQFLRNKLAIFGLLMIIVFSAATIFAPYIAPNPPDKQFFDGLTLEGAPLAPIKHFGSALTF
jgi:peptide/nickel transport system permease protein